MTFTDLVDILNTKPDTSPPNVYYIPVDYKASGFDDYGWYYDTPFGEMGPFSSKELAEEDQLNYNDWVKDKNDWHIN